MKQFAAPALCLGILIAAGVGYAAEHALKPRLTNTALNDADFKLSRESDGSCTKLIGLAVTPEEVCLARTNRPKILIGGDSHAMALNTAALTGQSNLNTLLIGGHSCRLLQSVVQTPVARQSWANNCSQITADFISAAKTESIQTIVIATHGPSYDDDGASAGSGPGHTFVPDTYNFQDLSGHFLNAEQADLEGYQKLISTLMALGKRVVFVVDVPGVKINPHSCIARLPLIPAKSCDLSVDEVANRQRDYRAFINVLSAKFPSLIIFDATKAICSDLQCPAADKNGYFYYDTHHLSAHGSKIVLSALATKLKEQ